MVWVELVVSEASARSSRNGQHWTVPYTIRLCLAGQPYSHQSFAVTAPDKLGAIKLAHEKAREWLAMENGPRVKFRIILWGGTVIEESE